MRIIPILTSILVAATTANAQPREEHRERVPFHDPYRPPRSDRDWVQIGTPSQTRVGTQFFVVGRQAGWFRTLRFEVASGSVQLRRLRVYSPEGQQSIWIQRRIDRRHPVAYVDLGRPLRIDQLAVTTDRWPRGSYTIHGSSGRIPPQLPYVAQR